MGTVIIKIGIDYGTAYTKIAYTNSRDRNGRLEKVKFVKFPDGDLFHSSIVYLEKKSKKLYAPDFDQILKKYKPIKYLKMKILKDNDMLSETFSIQCSFVIFYLYKVLKYAKEYILKNEDGIITDNDQIIWLGNICVPVEYYSSKSTNLLTKLFTLAWESLDKNIDNDFSDFYASFIFAMQRDFNSSNFIAYPEIAAGIQSLVSSRETRPGVYIYLDIGGGTLDIAGFRVSDNEGSKNVGFYMGAVRSYGIDWLIHNVIMKSNISEKAIRINLLTGNILSKENSLLPFDKIQTMLAEIIVKSKQKDRQDWMKMFNPPMLPILLGGGGADFKWYKDIICKTYYARNHRNCNIPEYNISKVCQLNIQDNLKKYSHRLTVAYGLAIQSQKDIIGFPDDYEIAKKEDKIIELNEELIDKNREKYGN